MIVIWLLILRGVAIEFRLHQDHPLWRGFWDTVFSLASVLLGAACGSLTETREEPTPTPVPAKTDEGKQTYDVQRGSIYDTIKGLGRIVSKEETPL